MQVCFQKASRSWSATIFVQTWGSRGRPGCLKDCKRHGTGDKDEKSVNGTQIFQWEVFHRENGTTFSGILFIPKNFQWNKPKSPFTSQLEFPEFFWQMGNALYYAWHFNNYRVLLDALNLHKVSNFDWHMKKSSFNFCHASMYSPMLTDWETCLLGKLGYSRKLLSSKCVFCFNFCHRSHFQTEKAISNKLILRRYHIAGLGLQAT